MYLKDLIRTDIGVVNASDKTSKALDIVTRFQLTHIPIVNKKHLEGLVTEECLWTLDESEPLENASDHFVNFYLNENQVILDAFEVFERYDTNVIPVVNAQGNYEGMLIMEDVVNYFSRFSFISENGATLEIQVPIEKYSMTDIGKIVEGNNARLYGAIITDMKSDTVNLLIKMSGENLSSVGETFERFGYTVKEKYYEDQKEELLEDRYKQLQKYLNI